MHSTTTSDASTERGSTPGNVDDDRRPEFTPESFPQELRQRPQWVVFRSQRKVAEATGKHRLDKVPFDPSDTQHMANIIDSTTWSTFDHALMVYKEATTLDGIGFVFSEDDPYTAVDFDECVSGGMIDPWVASWAERMGGYMELSPSRTGVHIIVKGRLSGKGKKRLVERHKVEMYDRGRFFTVTGWRIDPYQSIVDAQDTIDELYLLVCTPPKDKKKLKRLLVPALTNEEIVSKARTAANGWKFSRLYDQGCWENLEYPSQSEADSALIWQMIFWNGGNRQQLIELFEASALYRVPRQKHGSYAERTVDEALAAYNGSYYDPKHRAEGIREMLEPYFRLLDEPIWRMGKWPSARKVLAAILLVACEHGSRTGNGVRVGLDVRTLSEVAHVSMRTLLGNSLPLLIEEKIIKWTKSDRGGKAGRFLLPLPINSNQHIHYPHKENVLLRINTVLGNEERKELLRASVGRGPDATRLRVGNAAQVILEHMVGTPGNRLTLDELAERTGRLKHNIRATMRKKLIGYNLVVEIDRDVYALAPDFWERWHSVLIDSGVTETENLKKLRHETDRLLYAGWIPGSRDVKQMWIHSKTGELFTRSAALTTVCPRTEKP